MKILFLGAGKRLSLLECFQRAAAAEGEALELHSVEASISVPISVAANVHAGPRFKDAGFGAWLEALAAEIRPDMVIPNMDSATVALSRMREALQKRGIWAVVSSPELCQAMEDKREAGDYFLKQGMPLPSGPGWPRILKSRLGFGSRDQAIVAGEAGRAAFLAGKNAADYVEQEHISGPEYTVDAYVSQQGRLVAAMSRRRLKVSDGEVDDSLSERQEPILALTQSLLAAPGWQGPLTLQFIVGPAGPRLIEVNPRFGGGVTHSIHCGLDFPRWLIRERLQRSLPDSPQWTEGSLMTRCRRDIFL